MTVDTDKFASWYSPLQIRLMSNWLIISVKENNRNDLITSPIGDSAKNSLNQSYLGSTWKNSRRTKY